MTEKDIDTVTEEIKNAILKAAKECIPKGCRSNYKPFWTKNI